MNDGWNHWTEGVGAILCVIGACFAAAGFAESEGLAFGIGAVIAAVGIGVYNMQ